MTPAVYDMLCEGDSIGVFQVESRAQMNMLPRLNPRELYDLVVQVAIVRPGPIEGDMVHPYLRRRSGQGAGRISLARIRRTIPTNCKAMLGKTYGVPLFQEQAMKLAIVAAEIHARRGQPACAARWRRSAMSATIHDFEAKMVEGMVARGYEREFAQRCYDQIKGFGSYGFPESHALSFARLVYVSSWIKCFHPGGVRAARCSIRSRWGSTRRRRSSAMRSEQCTASRSRPIDVNASGWDNSAREPARRSRPRAAARLPPDRRVSRGLGATRSGRARARRPFAIDRGTRPRAPNLPSARRCDLLADADACGSIGTERREALWEVRRTPPDAACRCSPPPTRANWAQEADAQLPAMPLSEEVAADYQTTRLSLKGHPMQFLRADVRGRGHR